MPQTNMRFHSGLTCLQILRAAALSAPLRTQPSEKTLPATNEHGLALHQGFHTILAASA
jgi:hypothetical protein